ncbi:MAG: MBL fold metallo-hydrolase [Clostridia bacterium]|nr:MBL fold metallo-hydrolase [Clostridia bacterium]
MADKNFVARQIMKDTWCISGEGCDCYLLIGEDEALMIDSGMSTYNIRAFAQSLTDRPVKSVINTHQHFDHTAANGWFDVIYGTEGIARSAKNVMGRDPSLYRLDYEFTIVHDGDILPLKGRTLRVIVLDCHAPGNLAVLDETNRILFPGDELECQQVLLLPGYAEEMGQIHSKPAASVETYYNAMSRLKALDDKFDVICPAHNGTPIDKRYLDTYLALAKKIMDGYEGLTDLTSPTYQDNIRHFPKKEANYRRGELDGASLIYCADLIFDKDYEKAADFPPATQLHIDSSTTARK